MEGLTRQAAAFIASTKFGDIPDGAVKAAKDAILDCCGVAIAAREDWASAILLDHAGEQSPVRTATVLSHGRKTSADHAAFTNGVLAHLLDYDDLHVGAGGHPSAVLFPVALALGEERGASGADILTAYAVGFEIGCRLGRQIARPSRAQGFHVTSVWGPLGAAAAAANLLRLDVDRTCIALAIAASSAGGLAANFGSMTKAFHCGSAARAGLVAAKLAQKGFTAARDILDGERGFIATFSQAPPAPDTMDTLGKDFVLSDGVEFRLYPGRPESQGVIAAALRLVTEHAIAPQDVEAIVYETSAPPVAAAEEKFSLPYSLAAVIMDRAAGVAQFTDEAVARPAAQALMRKFTHAHPDDRHGSGIVRLRLRNGREVSLPVTKSAIGSEQLAAKYRVCTDGVLSRPACEASLEMLLRLETLGDVGKLTNLFQQIS